MLAGRKSKGKTTRDEDDDDGPPDEGWRPELGDELTWLRAKVARLALEKKAARPPDRIASWLAARAHLNATGQSRVTLSLRR